MSIHRYMVNLVYMNSVFKNTFYSRAPEHFHHIKHEIKPIFAYSFIVSLLISLLLSLVFK